MLRARPILLYSSLSLALVLALLGAFARPASATVVFPEMVVRAERPAGRISPGKVLEFPVNVFVREDLPLGSITIDDGALKALRSHKSLLPSGVVSVDGVFRPGEVVLVNDTIKLVSSFNSSELESILGKHSSEIRGILGTGRRDVIARPEDMVFLDR